jgi:hypothetical protein
MDQKAVSGHRRQCRLHPRGANLSCVASGAAATTSSTTVTPGPT